MFIIFLLCFSSMLSAHETNSKIIGLIPMRNEEIMIEQCLRRLAHYIDEIIVPDDALMMIRLQSLNLLPKNGKSLKLFRKKNGTR